MDKLNFRYALQSRSRIHVGVSPDHYGKSLSAVNQLHETLKGSIPFDFEVTSEASVHILAGRHMKGMVSVEMVIKPNIAIDEAVSQLEQAKFHEGFELYFG